MAVVSCRDPYIAVSPSVKMEVLVPFCGTDTPQSPEALGFTIHYSTVRSPAGVRYA